MQQLYCWKQEVKYHVIHVLIYQFKLCFQQMLKIYITVFTNGWTTNYLEQKKTACSH